MHCGRTACRFAPTHCQIALAGPRHTPIVDLANDAIFRESLFDNVPLLSNALIDEEGVGKERRTHVRARRA
jgi:hypothetical protein